MSTKISSSILDLIKIKIIDKLVYKKNFNNFLSCNSYILSFYYNFGTSLFFFISCSIFYNVLVSDIILCNDSHDRGEIKDKKLPFMILNYCLSYPVLQTKKIEKSYALFYKWVPWITSLFCILIYTPKILINKLSCNFMALFLMKINDLDSNYYYNHYDNKNKNNKKKCTGGDIDNDDNNKYYNEDDNEKQITKLTEKLINIQWNKCKTIYWKCLFTHIYAFILNISLIFLLDFLLQGRFLTYIFSTFPSHREMENFSDKMTQMFYPFSICYIKNKLFFGREEEIICHLTLMEYYEKIFFIIWLYLIILSIFTFFYIIYLFSLFRDNYNFFFKYLLQKNLNYKLYIISKNIMEKHTKMVV